jgi:Cathepsin propeptide inhibitor domain (I29)
MVILAKFAAVSLLALSVKPAIIISQTGVEKSFLEFTAKHGKNYNNLGEFNKRMKLWKATDEFIRRYPADSFTMGHNKFSDWTPEEFQRLLSYKSKSPKISPVHRYRHPHEALDAWWIFGTCDSGMYKNWFWGCCDCPSGCKECSGYFFGGSACTDCPNGLIGGD